MASTLDSAAELVAETLLPLAGALEAADQDVAAFVRQLGWELPSVPAGFHDLQTPSAALVQHLAQLQVARLALEEGTGTDDDVLQALGLVAADLAVLAVDIGTLPNKLRAQLPQAYLDATGIADHIEQRLLDFMVCGALRRTFPTTYEILFALGLIEETVEAADPAHFQPLFILFQVRWDRIPSTFTDPGGLFRDVYGWGTPTLDTQRLFEAIRRLSTFLLGPAVLDYPDDNLVQALAPNATISADDGPPPLLLVPLLNLDVLKLDVAVFPVPTASPMDLQPLGLTLVVTGDISVPIPLSSTLTLTAKAEVDLSTGAALLLRPGQPPEFRSGLDSANPVAVSGSVGFRLTYAGEDGQRAPILTAPGGTVLDAKEVFVGFGAEGHSTGGVDGSVEGGLTGGRLLIKTDQVDGFLAKVLPKDGMEVDFEFGIGWSKARGVYFHGSAGLEATIGLHVTIGPLALESLHLQLSASGSGLALETSLTGSGELGPVAAAVDRVGLSTTLNFQRGNLGPADLSLAFKPPNGIGISVDAGPIAGGGYLFIDVPNGRYAGVLELKLYEVNVKAIGLIDTKLPDGTPGFSFLIIITADFPPIQLGFGFTLNGVGGLAGINRTMMLEALRAGVRTHALNSILFPEDPIKNAPRIISDLRAIFPPADRRYVFGPMLELGWGSPTLIIAEIGVVLELPSPVRLAILGILRAVLPTDQEKLVELHVDVLGTVDFGARKLGIDASLYDSRILAFAIFGDMALRLSWGQDPSFAMAVGGFHPRFQPPPAFPALRRMTAAISYGSNIRLGLQAYFALTSNTVQFGSQAELYASLAGFTLHGFLGFDALIVISPFGFTAEWRAGVDLSYEGLSLMGIDLDGILSGPSPWIVDGSASISFLFFSVSVHCHVQFGPDTPAPLPRQKVMDLLIPAFKDPSSWAAVLPDGAERAVSIKAPKPGASTIAVHPLGTLTVRQTVVPLKTWINRFAAAEPADGDTFQIVSAKTDETPQTLQDLTDYFARGQFVEMSDADKLAATAYELFPSGAGIGASGAEAGARDSMLEVRYETLYVPDPFMTARRGIVYGLADTIHLALSEQGAAALSSVLNTGIGAFTVPGTASQVSTQDTTYVVASTDNLSVRRDLTANGVTQHMAQVTLAAHLAAHPEEAGRLQVVAEHEAAA